MSISKAKQFSHVTRDSKALKKETCEQVWADAIKKNENKAVV